MNLVYVCHAFSGGPDSIAENKFNASRFVKSFMLAGDAVVCPQLYLDQCFDEATERDLAMKQCLLLLRKCDRVYVCGDWLTPGMIEEVHEAQKAGIKIVSFGSQKIWSPGRVEEDKPAIEDDP
jgi:hypothetical protein